MLFNSLVFALFLPLVFIFYWSLKRAPLSTQNFLLLVASYVFYGWWDWRFLILIFLSSCLDFTVGLAIFRSNSQRRRKALLVTSLMLNLGALAFFKYCNFFIDSFVDLAHLFGMQANPWSLRVILPVGISFYTFQTLSYTIDIYRRKIEPTTDPIAFFAFVSFFPQLVAGPIERASALLPQFLQPRTFDGEKARDGMRQMLWGLMKKMVIADNLAPHVETVFNNWNQLDSLSLIIGAGFFAIQVYCDFSGYSDIAIGCARLFGFNLMRNFAYPFFSRDFGEFWHRWHISLSTWFRDYVYIPLGGNRTGKARQIWNTLVTFTVSGLWHGASWNFVGWGFLNGVYLIPHFLQKNRVKRTDVIAQGRLLPNLVELRQLLVTTFFTFISFVVFRTASIPDGFGYIGRTFSPPLAGGDYSALQEPLLFCFGLLTVEWLQRTEQHPLEIRRFPKALRWSIYIALILIVLLFGSFGEQEFVYFQF